MLLFFGIWIASWAVFHTALFITNLFVKKEDKISLRRLYSGSLLISLIFTFGIILIIL